MRSALVVMALVGCGDGESSSGPIEVSVVFFDQVPAPAIDIVFHDASGIPLLATTTDAAGVVTLDDPSGVAMVTMLADDPTIGLTGFTKVGISGGDRPRFILNSTRTSSPPFVPRDLAITFAPNPPATADTFLVELPCGASFSAPPTGTTVPLEFECRRPDGKFDAVALAKAGDVEVGFAVLADLELATSGPTNLSFPVWRTNFSTLDVEWTDIPVEGFASPDFTVAVGGGTYEFRPAGGEAESVAVGGDLSRTFRFASDVGTSLRLGISVNYGPPRGGSASSRVGIEPTSNVQISLQDKLLAPIRSISLSGAESARPTIEWTQDGSHDDASCGFAILKAANGGWFMQLPPDDATSARVPALPPELARFEPTAAEFPQVLYRFNSYLPTYRHQLERASFDRPETFEESETVFRAF